MERARNSAPSSSKKSLAKVGGAASKAAPLAASVAGAKTPVAISSPAAPSSAREKILQTASRLFYAQGIRGTGIDTIIAESDVAKMTFYKYFPSKQNLVMEFLRVGEASWMEGLRQRAESKKHPRGQILAVFDFLEDWFTSPDFRGCALINTSVESPDRAQAEYQMVRQLKRQLAQYLKAKATQGKFKNSKVVAERLLLLIDGAIVRATMDCTPAPARNAKVMATLVLKAAQKK